MDGLMTKPVELNKFIGAVKSRRRSSVDGSCSVLPSMTGMTQNSMRWPWLLHIFLLVPVVVVASKNVQP